jgi:thymidylate synthase ThyX
VLQGAKWCGKIDLVIAPTEAVATVLKDSFNTLNEARLITLQVTFARSALAEMNTHRAFSRNSASSRAIPVQKMLDQVINNPFIPRRYSLAQKGMHTDSFVDYYKDRDRWEELTFTWWLLARDSAVEAAERGIYLGLHKQDVNRILEPFMMHTAIISATEWQNFFNQRLAVNENGNPLAYPPMHDAALAIWEAIEASKPEKVFPWNWHLPLIGFPGDEELDAIQQRSVSVARCARVSYLSHDGVRDVEADLRLYERLLAGMHLSPLEHVAQATPHGTANYKGWAQLRTRLEQANRTVQP